MNNFKVGDKVRLLRGEGLRWGTTKQLLNLYLSDSIADVIYASGQDSVTVAIQLRFKNGLTWHVGYEDVELVKKRKVPMSWSL